MNILALDTSGRHISLALLSEKGLLMEYNELVEDSASIRLPGLIETRVLPVIEEIGRIDALGACVGPGPFTGIRIGLTVCKALIAAHGFAFLPVNSLKAMAFPFLEAAGRVAGVMDAKRNECYAALYEKNHGGLIELMPPRLLKTDDLAERIVQQGVLPLVSGILPPGLAERLRGMGLRVVEREPFLAREMVRIVAREKESWLRDSQLLEPLYLREPDALIGR